MNQKAKDLLTDIGLGLFAAAAWLACLAVATHFDEPDVQSPAQVEYSKSLEKRKREMQVAEEMRRLNEIEKQRVANALKVKKGIEND